MTGVQFLYSQPLRVTVLYIFYPLDITSAYRTLRNNDDHRLRNLRILNKTSLTTAVMFLRTLHALNPPTASSPPANSKLATKLNRGTTAALNSNCKKKPPELRDRIYRYHSDSVACGRSKKSRGKMKYLTIRSTALPCGALHSRGFYPWTSFMPLYTKNIARECARIFTRWKFVSC